MTRGSATALIHPARAVIKKQESIPGRYPGLTPRFIARDLVPFDRAASVEAGRGKTAAVEPMPVRAAAATAVDIALVPQSFVFENASARHVAVVGDFNNWNPTATPMTRAEGGLWSAIVPMLPGRHVYGFMVNDSVFTLDPRTPKARDPDFGTDASVVMVGRP